MIISTILLSNSKLYLHSHIYRECVVYLVCYEGGNPVFPSVGVDEDAILSPQGFCSCPGCNGLLEGLVQKPGPRGRGERLCGRLGDFTMDVYEERAGLTEWEEEEFKPK